MIDIQAYSPWVQYTITVLIFLFSLWHIKPLSRIDIMLVLILISLGILSYYSGAFNEFPTNIRAILVPIIFIVVLNSNSYKYLKPLFIYCLFITILEYILYYSGLGFWRDITRLGILRPFGGLLGMHSTSLFLAVSLYLFGLPILGGFLAVLMMNLQTPIAYSVLFLRKKYILVFLIFSSVIFIALFKVGHLDVNSSVSMMNSYLEFFNYEYNYCFYIGCASNVIVIEGVQQYGIIADNGLVRTSFFFGVPWLLIYFILIFRNSKSKALPIVYYLTILHYPVAFGIVTSAIIGISINYFNNITYFKMSINKKRIGAKIRGVVN